MTPTLPVATLFHACVEAIREHRLIRRESRRDKEFHFQYWVGERLRETGAHYEAGGRNSYPDFRLVQSAEGYEVKGLAYPGRVADFDSNSQMPSGSHNGRSIYYIFGRYPAEPDGETYPVLDLVICHGDFLNADHHYVHKNKSVQGFGSYGDIKIRDRKMYVVPTPFGLVEGVAHAHTLILPAGMGVAAETLQHVGTLIRQEAAALIVGYSFDLRTNALTEETVPNPSAGHEHRFDAWRLPGSSHQPVAMRTPKAVLEELGNDEDGDQGVADT
ncbi:MAG TPA: hypothetical protein PKD53_11360 [Chloroflexaceae bacterium]|nr:hypothetical protein [Chloroflexaceae bacterium]